MKHDASLLVTRQQFVPLIQINVHNLISNTLPTYMIQTSSKSKLAERRRDMGEGSVRAFFLPSPFRVPSGLINRRWAARLLPHSPSRPSVRLIENPSLFSRQAPQNHALAMGLDGKR